MAIAVGVFAIVAGGTVFGLRASGVWNANLPILGPAATKLVDAGGDRKLTVGVITTRNLTKESYNSLLKFLQDELGNDVNYEISAVPIRGGQKAIDEVKQKIATKEWDIAFTFLPALSIAAQDGGYVFAAKTVSERKDSDSVFFVRVDSRINKFDDIVDNPSLKIALGSFDSAHTFYVPLFHLYGTALQASYGNSPDEIFEKVRLGTADVGVARSEQVLRRNSADPKGLRGRQETAQIAQANVADARTSHSYNSALLNSSNFNPGERKSIFRIVKPRNEDIPIPRSGVYISPNLSEAERELVMKTLLKAPASIQKEARYEQGDEPDYTSFRKVANRVNEILNCADYRSDRLDSNQFYPARFYKRNGCSS
jgi:serine/threonine-protein kinase